LRPPFNCNCRGNVDTNPEFELECWYFIHANSCLKKDEQKIAEFAEPILAFVEKEGQSF
jgi:hypothetical protein